MQRSKALESECRQMSLAQPVHFVTTQTAAFRFHTKFLYGNLRTLI